MIAYNIVKIRNLNKHSNNFLYILITVNMFYSFIFVKYHILNSINNQTIFTLSSFFILAWAYVHNLYDYIERKKYNNINKLEKYKYYSNLNENMREEYNKLASIVNKDHRSFFSEKTLSILFYSIKLIIYYLILIFFSNIGKKMDNSITTSWVRLFIPSYILALPIIVFGLIHCYANINKSLFINIVTTFCSIGIILLI
jgi:hypothetical protein